MVKIEGICGRAEKTARKRMCEEKGIKNTHYKKEKRQDKTQSVFLRLKE